MSTPRRALLSVSDKSGIQEFGRALVERGFQLLSTGGTARTLREAGLPVTEVSEITGHPEIMDGRVKTLHPAIHGPLLARRDHPADLDALAHHGYRPIDLVAVNLYPFRETIRKGGVSVSEAMEQVDIGGPTMIRAAAKNHANVLVVVDPADYGRVLEGLDEPGGEGLPLRRELAAKVFRHISSYDEAVAGYLEKEESPGDDAALARRLPANLSLTLARKEQLRYGENPDQAAGFYEAAGQGGHGIGGLVQHHGKALSYNNLLDLDGAILSLSPFALSPRPAVCIIKHTTPSGLAVGDTVAEAYGKALACDPVSAFGSVIATNREVDATAAQEISELFVECLVAPSFSTEAMEILTRKKNVRLLSFPGGEESGETDAAFPASLGSAATEAFAALPEEDPVGRSAAHFLAGHNRAPGELVPRGIYGGVLVQTPPAPPFFGVEDPGLKIVSERVPTTEEREEMAFAWAAVYGVKSNAIVLAGGGATLGIGAGQMSRVDSSRLAVQKATDAGLDLTGCVLASDAFFPFRDGVDAAAEAGARAIIQPGGSVRDEGVIAAADEHGIAMILTGRRLFRH
ncbi:MAG: bifunctional phosphoribosylaminoimidazolecarboxamide formyltransferase/IMP cyclohydrolase [Gemmatimonadota bacterium]